MTKENEDTKKIEEVNELVYGYKDRFRVEFIKKDGTPRVMLCSKFEQSRAAEERKIKEEEKFKETGESPKKSTRKPLPHILTVTTLNDEKWVFRSLDKRRITSICEIDDKGSEVDKKTWEFVEEK